MTRAYIALGGNIGDREAALRSALEALMRLPGTAASAVSPVYETEPVGGPEGQRSFYNAVAAVETDLSPHALLGALLGIEAAIGRVRGVKNGPRIVDLDLLLYGSVTADSAELTLPHPRMWQRAFVLVPLCDIAPGFREHLKAVSTDGVRRLPDVSLTETI